MTLGEWLRRYRGSRGYGVHSPSAFRIVTEVVRAPKGVVYYGEERLATMPDAYGRDLERARLLLRLAAMLQPSQVWMAGKAPSVLRDALSMAGVLRIYEAAAFPERRKDADLVVLWQKMPPKKEMQALLNSGKTIAGFGMKPQKVALLRDWLDSGVLIDGLESFIVIGEKGPGKHCYEVGKF